MSDQSEEFKQFPVFKYILMFILCVVAASGLGSVALPFVFSNLNDAQSRTVLWLQDIFKNSFFALLGLLLGRLAAPR
jgi:hypothetical protein